tara:strand:+ start:3242 stop:3442 length:201 start_codon:yes stop_codon:yes gene_type:complete
MKITQDYYNKIKKALKENDMGYLKTEFKPKFNKVYISYNNENQASEILCDVLNDFDIRNIIICKDW